MKTVPTVHLADGSEAAGLPELPDEMRRALTDVAAAAREGLLEMSVAAGLAVMQTMFEAEICEIAGPRGKHDPNRTAVRHGTGRGSVTLGGRRMPVDRPRARTVDGHEVPLPSYAHFASDDLLSQVVMERMLAGLATRRHARCAEPVGDQATKEAKSTSKSAVSRRFVRQTQTAGRADGPRPDRARHQGAHDRRRAPGRPLRRGCAGHLCRRTKVPVGLWDGSTESKTVVTALLADLVARGLNFADRLLVVIDDAKALSAAMREVFGDKAAVQRCTLHKRRNVADHLPDKDKQWVDAKLVKAFTHPDPDAGLDAARRLTAQLDKTHPGAAASLREGLDQMFTVARLGIDGRLAKTLTTSNPVESMISIARTTNRNVTRWRDGQMVLRWTAAGILNAERSSAASRATSRCPSSCKRSTDAHPDQTETVSTAA